MLERTVYADGTNTQRRSKNAILKKQKTNQDRRFLRSKEAQQLFVSSTVCGWTIVGDAVRNPSSGKLEWPTRCPAGLHTINIEHGLLEFGTVPTCRTCQEEAAKKRIAAKAEEKREAQLILAKYQIEQRKQRHAQMEAEEAALRAA
jgi:hypothetical protein